MKVLFYKKKQKAALVEVLMSLLWRSEVEGVVDAGSLCPTRAILQHDPSLPTTQAKRTNTHINHYMRNDILGQTTSILITLLFILSTL